MFILKTIKKTIKFCLVVINAQLERKQRLVLELSAEKQRLEIMKKNLAMMKEDIAKKRTNFRTVCKYLIKLLVNYCNLILTYL